MMDGITVLEQVEIIEYQLSIWSNPSIMITILFIGICVLFLIGVLFIEERPLLMIIVCCVGFYFINPFNENPQKAVPTGRYQYRCIVDDSVSIEDLNEKYNIIGKDGDIYVLEDKE